VRKLLWPLLWLSVSSAVACAAQSERLPLNTRLDFDYDFRSRLAGTGGSQSLLYDGSTRLAFDPADRMHVEVFAARKFGSLQLQQASVAADLRSSTLEAGVIRLPFGIYDYRETYASGIIDYPMPRVDYALNSVDWGVPGAKWSGGGPKLQVEAAAFDGRGAGVWSNLNNVGGTAVRLQTGLKDAIIGLSRWDGFFDTNWGGNVRNSTHVNGVDLRYTRPHLLVRGEYLFGTLAERMEGAYLDVYYHLPKFAKWTLAARAEMLRPGPDDPARRQLTLGVRYTSSPQWIFVVNWRRSNTGYTPSWTPLSGSRGDWYFQVYRKLRY
jgi:hypothetical protein